MPEKVADFTGIRRRQKYERRANANNALTEQAKRDVIDSLVRRALLDGSGNLTIEFEVPRPEMSFGFLSS